MNIYVTQTITIHKLSIGSITNSSVVQIGTSGIIKPLSNLYNSGGFKGAAPTIGQPPTPITSGFLEAPSLIPLSTR